MEGALVAHAFDTELAKPTRTILVEKAIALLAPLSAMAPHTGYLRAVDEFGGVVRSWTDEDGIKLLEDQLAGRSPAILVSIGDGVGSPKGDRFNLADDLELLVYHVNNNMRGLAIGRNKIDVAGAASNQADPGLHVALDHARELLVGQYADTSPAIKHVRYDRTVELVTRRDLTIWLQTFQVRTSISVNRYRNATQLLESIRWRLIREAGEANQPDPAIKDSTLETVSDNLEPPP
jgi:hypothetical protein